MNYKKFKNSEERLKTLILDIEFFLGSLSIARTIRDSESKFKQLDVQLQIYYIVKIMEILNLLF
jgi:hypothetical protein